MRALRFLWMNLILVVAMGSALETSSPGSTVTSVVVVDFESNHTVALMPEQHMYMDWGAVGVL
jgi:hypothetical protein